MNSDSTVIVGAGLAGVACAYHLAARRGVPNVVLVDEREPLTLTSAVGTMGYRNWWPGPDDARGLGVRHGRAARAHRHTRLHAGARRGLPRRAGRRRPARGRRRPRRVP